MPLLVLVSLQALTRAGLMATGCACFHRGLSAGSSGVSETNGTLVAAGIASTLIASTVAYHWPDLARAAGIALTGQE